MNIINAGYDSTNYYLIQAAGGWLMVDTGWAGTRPKLAHALRQKGIRPDEIQHLIVTHFHPDHAGLVHDLKAEGVKHVLHQCQVAFAGDASGSLVVSTADSRDWLSRLGLSGAIIPTPGHSDDSVSLVIDGICAFTGDLTPEALSDSPVVAASWRAVYERNVKTIYPGHGPAINVR